MLYVFGGLPGVGKTSLARSLARDRGAFYLRVDTIEQALRASGLIEVGERGYRVAYEVAAENLALGLDVVADSVNPLSITREAWRRAASRSNVSFVEVEVICSNGTEHRERVETRAADVAGLELPTWADVARREYEHWEGPHIVIDTAGRTLEQSSAALRTALGLKPDGLPAQLGDSGGERGSPSTDPCFMGDQ